MKEKVNFEKYFKNKKITLMGLGGLGRGVVEAEFLIKYGADLIITDLASEEDLAEEIKRVKLIQQKYIKNGAKVILSLGGQKIEDFKGRDIVLSANGVPLDNKFILTSKEFSKITTKSIALVYWILEQEKAKIKTIGVTGTKGKSTTTALVEHLLKTNGENVFSGGNLRGAANLPILEKIQEGDYLLAELDSWLLQGFGNQKISPQFSIFTNFFNDHQNYYHSMEKYFLDKSYIFQFQKEDDVLITTKQSQEMIEKYFSGKIKSKNILADPEKNPDWNYSIFGEHNQKNIAQVLVLAKELNIDEEIQKKAMETFVAVEGRLQFLGEKKGILFYNDNNATNPVSSEFSLKALKEKFQNSNIFLLAGGADKEFDFENFAKTIKEEIKYTVLFVGSGTEKIVSYWDENFKEFEIVDNMKDAFEKIVNQAQKGDVVVLSPGAASFGCFKNEYDKNDQFIQTFEKFTKN